jgi:predicted RNase H-like nuclease (RuvC/YqgF family)
MSWVLLSLGVYTFVYCVVLLFLENFSGGMLFGMDKQVIAALIGAGVSVAAILGSIIKDRISEKGEHDALKEQINNEHAGIGKQITSEHTILTNQIQAEHASLEKQLSAARTRLDHLHDESIRMEGLRKDVEKQGIDVSAIKAGIDALVQKNGENKVQVQVLSQNLAISEQNLADTRSRLYECQKELTQYQRENEQLKQQIYNLQHPQQSWDEPER